MSESSKSTNPGEEGVYGSVLEFLNSIKATGEVQPARLGRFVGKLSKGSVENEQLRTLTDEDLERGIPSDALIIVQLDNLDRSWNVPASDNHERTGKFADFMDEVEEIALHCGCRYVWAEKVVSGFLPEKLEARGYERKGRNDWNNNPDYVKGLRQPF